MIHNRVRRQSRRRWKERARKQRRQRRWKRQRSQCMRKMEEKEEVRGEWRMMEEDGGGWSVNVPRQIQ